MSQPTEQQGELAAAVGPQIEAFRTYPFSTDEAFQEGLASILSSGVLQGKTDDEKEQILKTAEVFYFNRITGSALTVDDIPIPNPPLSMGASVADSSSPDDVESRTLTFAELKNLIEQGKTDEIPNNRHIPEAINDASPSESTAPSRKKPWEGKAE